MRTLLALAVLYSVAGYMHWLTDPRGLLMVGMATMTLCVMANVPEMLLLDGLSLHGQGQHQAALWILKRGTTIGALIFGSEHRLLAELYMAQSKCYRALDDHVNELVYASKSRSAAGFSHSAVSLEDPATGRPHALLASYHFESAHFMGLVALTVIPSIVAIAHSAGYGGLAHSAAKLSPVLFISNSRAGSLLGGGCDEEFDHDELRSKYEELYLEGKYADAISGLLSYLKQSPEDIKAYLIIGKAYFAMKQPDQAIDFLALARNKTRDQLQYIDNGWFYLHNKTEEQAHPFRTLAPKFSESVPDRNSRLSREETMDIDNEARHYLEESVMAAARKSPPERVRFTKAYFYQRDPRYKLLRACMQMAQQCHNRWDKMGRQDALYRLADELSTQLPLEALSDYQAAPAHGWDEAAARVLNSQSNAELRFNEKLLLLAGSRLKNSDIRKAAGMHLLASDGFVSKDGRIAALEQALKLVQTAEFADKDEFEANCHYDLGHALFDAENLDDADREFTSALSFFEKDHSQNTLVISQVHYDRGLIAYFQGRLSTASSEFSAASSLRCSETEESSQSNLAILATEYDVRPEDEAFLVHYAKTSEGIDPDPLSISGNNPIAQTQVGLYYCKRAEWDKAEPWLRNAANSFFTNSNAPQLWGATSGTIGDEVQDTVYPQQAILQEMFSRSEPVTEVIASRYEDPDNGVQHLTNGHAWAFHTPRSLRHLCRILYDQVLIHQGKIMEAAFLDARASATDQWQSAQIYNPTIKLNADQYLGQLHNSLESVWFAPASRFSTGNVVVQFRVNRAGSVSIDSIAGRGNQLRYSIEEALRMAPLPPPGADWNENTEITAVFASEPTALEPVLQPEPQTSKLKRDLSRFF